MEQEEEVKEVEEGEEVEEVEEEGEEGEVCGEVKSNKRVLMVSNYRIPVFGKLGSSSLVDLK